jgi:hypothetical protein
MENEMMEALKKHIEFLESDEGKLYIEKIKEKIEIEKRFKDRWIERLKKHIEPNVDLAIEKLLKKYDSDEYVNREYKLGYEPRNQLLWLVHDYAEKYCEECYDEKYLNDFTASAYYIGGYVIQMMIGQGSVVTITKQL